MSTVTLTDPSDVVTFTRTPGRYGYVNAAGAWVWSCRPGPVPAPEVERRGTLTVTAVNRQAGVVTFGHRSWGSTEAAAAAVLAAWKEPPAHRDSGPPNRHARRAAKRGGR